MNRSSSIWQRLDGTIILLYLLMVSMGWVAIYATTFDGTGTGWFDLSQTYGRQLTWIIASIVMAVCVILIDSKFYPTFTIPIYVLTLLILGGVLLFGQVTAGSKSWFVLGTIKIQPGEFAKFAVALTLAKLLSLKNADIRHWRYKLQAATFLGLPVMLVLLQGDMGSALVYAAFVLMFYREGLSGWYLIAGALGTLLFVLTLLVDKYMLLAALGGLAALGMIYRLRTGRIISPLIFGCVCSALLVAGVDYTFNEVLKPHQQQRIMVLLGAEADLHGAAYNVTQSQIAIGSGGFWGKGFLQGTQTKFNFVPEQATDFIFCTIGEEWGFVGVLVVIGLFIGFLFRLIQLAERQRSSFSRIFGYGIVSVMCFHFVINIGMTIGLMPVIGIPLPFFSYGGSNLMTFTLMTFVMLRLDADRDKVLR